MRDTLLSLQCWLLTKASADAERAKRIRHACPELAKLLEKDADSARWQAHLVDEVLNPSLHTPPPTTTHRTAA